jgi:DNA polymerase zeta
VSKARETLERAIHLVETTTRWGAQVVYGDTDSLFVLVPGKSREQAFKIGAEIAEAITLDNPKPVKLKLEKVYQPCILQVRILECEECKGKGKVKSVCGSFSTYA